MRKMHCNFQRSNRFGASHSFTNQLKPVCEKTNLLLRHCLATDSVCKVIKVSCYNIFKVLACDQPVLDGFNWHNQASVHCSKQCHQLSSATSREKFLGTPIIELGVGGCKARTLFIELWAPFALQLWLVFLDNVCIAVVEHVPIINQVKHFWNNLAAWLSAITFVCSSHHQTRPFMCWICVLKDVQCEFHWWFELQSSSSL